MKYRIKKTTKGNGHIEYTVEKKHILFFYPIEHFTNVWAELSRITGKKRYNYNTTLEGAEEFLRDYKQMLQDQKDLVEGQSPKKVEIIKYE